MNPAWTEGKIEFDFSGALKDPATGVECVAKPDTLAQPLKSVDFVARYEGETWLIELKDPEGASAAHVATAIQSVWKEILNDHLRKEHLLPKLYGTYVYLVESGHEPRGRVRYVAFIGMTNLSAADRSTLADKIQRTVDRIGPKVRHGRYWPVAEVHNLASWNAANPTMAAVRHP